MNQEVMTGQFHVPCHPGAGFTKIDFDYGLDIVDSQTSDRHLN